MKLKSTSILVTSLLIGGLAAVAAEADYDKAGTYLGPEKIIHKIEYTQVKNFENERLGRIREVTVDMTNSRIVEVFVISGDILGSGLGGTVRAVPPTALIKDRSSDTYFIDISREAFLATPEVKLSDAERLRERSRIAATYRRFGQEPYFWENTADVAHHDGSIKRPIGHVQRGGFIVGMPVGNLQNEIFGRVYALNYDFASGRLVTLVIQAPGSFESKSVLAAREVKFDATRNAIVFDADKREFEEQPRYVAIDSVFANMGDHHARYREAYAETSVAMSQSEQYTHNADDEARAGMPVDSPQ